MIAVKELINLTRDSLRNDLEEKMKNNAMNGYSSYVTRTAQVPNWLQEELKEAGYTVTFEGIDDSQISISWKVED